MFNATYMEEIGPRCVIVEEPFAKQRFRYKSESRSGPMTGSNTSAENKTYPTIKVEGYRGKATVVVSCVTTDEPFRPHPNELVGREGCNMGVCRVIVPEDTMTVTFQNLGIQRTKRNNIEESLRIREKAKVDPFGTGFACAKSQKSVDLKVVRLCFQVTIHTNNGDRQLSPVASEPIHHTKFLSDLLIVRLSDCVCPVDGGNKDITLVCKEVEKQDVQIRFFEVENGREVWEAFGEFRQSDVYKQVVIWFRPPKYKTLDVTEPVKVFVQLRRPSDGETSEPIQFRMVPLATKRRAEGAEMSRNKRILLELRDSAKNQPLPGMDYFMNIPPPPRKDTPKTLLGLRDSAKNQPLQGMEWKRIGKGMDYSVNIPPPPRKNTPKTLLGLRDNANNQPIPGMNYFVNTPPPTRKDTPKTMLGLRDSAKNQLLPGMDYFVNIPPPPRKDTPKTMLGLRDSAKNQPLPGMDFFMDIPLSPRRDTQNALLEVRDNAKNLTLPEMDYFMNIPSPPRKEVLKEHPHPIENHLHTIGVPSTSCDPDSQFQNPNFFDVTLSKRALSDVFMGIAQATTFNDTTCAKSVEVGKTQWPTQNGFSHCDDAVQTRNNTDFDDFRIEASELGIVNNLSFNSLNKIWLSDVERDEMIKCLGKLTNAEFDNILEQNLK